MSLAFSCSIVSLSALIDASDASNAAVACRIYFLVANPLLSFAAMRSAIDASVASRCFSKLSMISASFVSMSSRSNWRWHIGQQKSLSLNCTRSALTAWLLVWSDFHSLISLTRSLLYRSISFFRATTALSVERMRSMRLSI